MEVSAEIAKIEKFIKNYVEEDEIVVIRFLGDWTQM